MLNIAIFGATSSIAEHCARIWVEHPCHLVLIGRDYNKLSIVADDLRVRCPDSTIEIIVNNHVSVDDINILMNNLWSKLSAIDIALIAQGSLSNQAICQNNLIECNNSFNVNAATPLLLCEAIAQKMEATQKGTLAIIGSVAGDRGRKSNYIYGATKGMIEVYTQGMQHRFANSPVHIALIKPGPTDTPMTAHLKNGNIKLATARSVAKDIVNGIKAKRRVIYTPRKWKIIMTIIKLLPFIIFKKLDI